MSDSNSIAVLEQTSLIVYDPDIFNCSRHWNSSRFVRRHTTVTPRRCFTVPKLPATAAPRRDPQACRTPYPRASFISAIDSQGVDP